jgi:hypothetical protein
MDALEDVEFREGNIGTRMGANDAAAIASIHDEDDTSGEVDIEGGRTMRVGAGDELLSTMFASYVREDDGSDGGGVVDLDRTVRADAVLPLLSLAIDDIGNSRMSISLDGMSFWDRLKFAICHVLRSNSICYSTDDVGSIDDASATRVRTQRIVDEAFFDEGAHVIPSSDFPALTRCAFRMASNASANPHASSNLGWGTIFLHIYHAAAIATIETPRASNQSRKNPGGVDRQALLMTIESHVLLPLCTGASINTITSILDACTQECCSYCKRDCANSEIEGFGMPTISLRVLPAWAVARVVLFIICARASNLSHLTTSTNFGPRVVFRMASDLLLKAQTIPGSKSRPQGFASDEVEYALKVLLNLSAVSEGKCRVCRDDELIDNSDRHAYDVLKCSYYAGKGIFVHRYKDADYGNNSYHHELGLKTISSYCNLVRASLGSFDDAHSSKELFRADTARTWIDAANMLLGENFCSPSPGKATSNILEGTAMATVIIVVVFFEVPSSQNDIVRSIYDRLANTTSYNSHSVERKREQSYYILISILAWSLAAIDGKHSLDDVVRTKRSQILSGKETTVLDPLCNLLSKSALSRDHHLNDGCDDVPRLSYWALRRLARALTPIPSGRDVILAMAQKNISSSSCLHPQRYESSFFEPLPNPSASIDSMYFAIDCLCALIEKFDPSNESSTDESGQRALGMLTDVMIQSHSELSKSAYTLSINVASWVISELNQSARLGKLTKYISRRLLRACYAGLLKFTALEESESGDYSSCFLPERIFYLSHSHLTTKKQLVALRARNDVYGMLRLAVSLYDEIAKFDANMAPLLLESHTLLKPHLIQTLLHGTDQKTEPTLENATFQSAIDQLFRDGYGALRRGFKPCDESTSFAVDGVILIIVLQGAARMICKRRRPSPEMVDTDALRCLNEYIFDAETFCLQEGNFDHPSFIEAGKRYLEKSTVQFDETPTDSTEFKAFQMSLCDVMTEILLRGAATDHHDASILLAVNTLLGFKRQVDAANVFCDMPHNSICNLLELSSRHLRPLLSSIGDKKDLLPELDMLVMNVLDFCKINANGKTCRCNLPSLWSLYCSLVDEESAQLLICFVKEYYVEVGCWADKDANFDIDKPSTSLLSITSSDALDKYARNLREKILSALSEVLVFITSSQNTPSIEERTTYLDIMFQLLLQLCQDLDSSFDGLSGGIQTRLFLAFLDAIDKCVDAVVALFESMPTTTQHHIGISFASLHKASLIIWELFCENTLRKASVVKVTLKICIEKIPKMILRAERALDVCIIRKSPCEHIHEILYECNTQLMSKPIHETKEAPGIAPPSDDNGNIVSNIERSSSRFGEIEGSDAKVPPSTKGDSGVGQANARSERPLNSEDKHVQMPFVSNKTLMWVYYFAFDAFANIWNESYRIIAGSSKMRRQMVKSPQDKARVLASRRIVDFSRSHTSICRLFGVRKGPKDETSKDTDADSGESETILAELLSFQQKAKLCVCVERMAMALTLALKRVIKYFKESTPLSIGRKRFNESKLNESLICILGWLNSVETAETGFNLIAGFMRWRANERRSFSQSPIDDEKGGTDDYTILGRLPKVIMRLEGLEAELRELNVTMVDSNGRDDVISIESRLILDGAVSDLMNDIKALEVPCDFGGMIRRCIRISDDVKDETKSNELDDDPPSDEYESDDDPNNGGGDEFSSSLTGKRRTRLRYPYANMRKSRRVSLRSRNETVDDWLAMDDDEFGSAPGERYNADDAFVDLEDFIVEG